MFNMLRAEGKVLLHDPNIFFRIIQERLKRFNIQKSMDDPRVTY